MSATHIFCPSLIFLTCILPKNLTIEKQVSRVKNLLVCSVMITSLCNFEFVFLKMEREAATSVSFPFLIPFTKLSSQEKK